MTRVFDIKLKQQANITKGDQAFKIKIFENLFVNRNFNLPLEIVFFRS